MVFNDKRVSQTSSKTQTSLTLILQSQQSIHFCFVQSINYLVEFNHLF